MSIEEKIQTVIQLWNSTVNNLNKIVKQDYYLNDYNARKIIVNAVDGNTVEELQELFKKADSTPFLTGDNKDSWSADFLWCLRQKNYTEILNGKYDKASFSVKQKDIDYLVKCTAYKSVSKIAKEYTTYSRSDRGIFEPTAEELIFTDAELQQALAEGRFDNNGYYIFTEEIIDR